MCFEKHSNLAGIQHIKSFYQKQRAYQVHQFKNPSTNQGFQHPGADQVHQFKHPSTNQGFQHPGADDQVSSTNHQFQCPHSMDYFS